MSSKIRVGVIGTSWWADAMYLPSLKGVDAAEVVACCGRDRERAQAFAARWDIPHVYTNWEHLLEEAPLDAVIITTPNHTHHDMTLRAVEQGLHVLCEKPLGLNYGEARRMTEAAAAHSRVTMTPFTYSFVPMTQRIKGLLEEGYLGQPYHLNFRYFANFARDPGYFWRFDPRYSGSGVLGDIGSHFLYLALWFFGDVTHVMAEVSRIGPRVEQDPAGRPYTPADDVSTLLLTFANGAQGVIQASALAHEPTPWGQAHYFDLHGSGGTLHAWTDWEQVYELKGARHAEVGYQDLEIPQLMHNGQKRTDIQQMYKETFRQHGKMTGEFIEAIRTQGSCRPDLAEGARVQRVLDAALLSSTEGRRVAIEEITG